MGYERHGQESECKGLFLKRLAGAVFRHRRDCDGILAELGDSWESQTRAAEVPHGGRGRRVEDGLELSKGMVARWLMAVKDNLLVIRMDVAGLTQWGTSWRRERVCGRGGIRTNCGNLRKKSKDYGGRQLKVESKRRLKHLGGIIKSLMVRLHSLQASFVQGERWVTLNSNAGELAATRQPEFQ